MRTQELIESRQYLSRIGLWPGPKYLDIESWLNNFDPGEDSALAEALLESQVHIDQPQIKYAVFSSIRALSSRTEFGPANIRAVNWRAFLERAMVSFPLGRAGDVTASGHIFGRIAVELGFREDQIFDTEHLIGSLLKGKPRDVLILDDMCGTGTQFARDWARMYNTPQGKSSLEELSGNDRIGRVYFVPLVCTVDAKRKVEETCSVTVAPTYLLDTEYYVRDADSRLVPEALRPRLDQFIVRYGPDGHVEGQAGYGDLGLAVSFEHGCPNNTLPVLQWGMATRTWRPLVQP